MTIEIAHRTGPAADYAWPRIANFLLGFWLVVSVYLWPHAAGERTNVVILGVLLAVVAVWAMFVHYIHFANVVIGALLFVSTVTTPHASVATTWTQIVVAVAAIVLSIVPSTWALVSRR